MKIRFVGEMLENENGMNGNMKKEYAKLREDPYFPEKLPKYLNLRALLDMIPGIMVQIIRQIKPSNYVNEQLTLINEILWGTNINILKGNKMFIASHYKRAASKVCFCFVCVAHIAAN